MAAPLERQRVYRFWGVLNLYSGFEEIIVDELSSIGCGDTREEALHDVTFKVCDEIDRLHGMGKRVTARTEEEAASFAEKLHEELRSGEYPGDYPESWSLLRITVDMEKRPPGKTQEELDAIAAFERESWAEYLAAQPRQ